MTTEKLIKYLELHGHNVLCGTTEKVIRVTEHYAHAESQIVELPATYEAVRAWLGY